jgi:hypothetical protein
MTQQELGSGDTREKPIKLGGALFTMVEPHRGHEVEYNRWYERDHFYAGCMIGAWTIAGGRFVATRECKAKRFPASSPICPDATGEWIKWGTDQVNWLHANDRMFPHRDHVHTLMYRMHREVPGHADAVPVELALDHHFPNVVAIIGEVGDDASLEAVDAWFDAHRPAAEVTAELTPVPLLSDAPSDVPRDAANNRFLHLMFLDDDALAVWDERFAGLDDRFATSGLGRILFASPFLATVPGTDAYTDQLW